MKVKHFFINMVIINNILCHPLCSYKTTEKHFSMRVFDALLISSPYFTNSLKINRNPFSTLIHVVMAKARQKKRFTLSATTMKQCCSRSVSIPILYLAKLHHANYCASISKISLILLATISRLNCPPLQDSVPVELHSESWIER